MIRVIVAGSRDFNDYNLLEQSLLNIIGHYKDEEVTIISGGARGADRLGERFATEYGLKCKVFPAQWDIYGKSAGYRRNEEMANNADMLIAFWDGISRGTKHMIDIAKSYGLETHVVNI